MIITTVPTTAICTAYKINTFLEPCDLFMYSKLQKYRLPQTLKT